jgi:DNA-3-methyladenine glycosylase
LAGGGTWMAESLPPPLPRDFYARDPIVVARALLGTELVSTLGGEVTSGRIVETEAYLAEDDPASHSYRGPSRRNTAMFGPAGHAYVYTIHARFCFNAVTESVGRGSAVLIRAIEPRMGGDAMAERRDGRAGRELTGGPARLCAALAIDRSVDGWDLTLGERLWIGARGAATHEVVRGPRIGISKGVDLPLRFCLRDSTYLSRKPVS